MGCVSSVRIKDNTQKIECVVCFNDADTILYPCGHYCMCYDCVIRLSQYDRQRLGSIRHVKINIRNNNGVYCPLCRKLGLPTKVFQNDAQQQDYNTI